MSGTRHEFSSSTKNVLAKRVAYKCSNPTCRRVTIGPNTEGHKSSSIGVAAHITAASAGGARFSEALSPEERADIENGIWLCQNCARLIDVDENLYTVELLKRWKEEAEDEAFIALQENRLRDLKASENQRPYADVELIWYSGMKRTLGASAATRELYGDTPISMLQVIWHNHLIWNYRLKVFNNSSVPLYNLKLYKHESAEAFTIKDKIPAVNNLPPFQDLTLGAETEMYFDGTGKEAIDLMEPKFPRQIQGMQMLLEYRGENRNVYFTELKLKDRELSILHCEARPVGYAE